MAEAIWAHEWTIKLVKGERLNSKNNFSWFIVWWQKMKLDSGNILMIKD